MLYVLLLYLHNERISNETDGIPGVSVMFSVCGPCETPSRQ